MTGLSKVSLSKLERKTKRNFKLYFVGILGVRPEIHTCIALSSVEDSS